MKTKTKTLATVAAEVDAGKKKIRLLREQLKTEIRTLKEKWRLQIADARKAMRVVRVEHRRLAARKVVSKKSA